ncbi:MAG: universal stress protein [Solirubrobacteraceae bacterium]
MGAQGQIQAVTCSRCGAVIGRHEPLVIAGDDAVRRSTLAIESRAPVKGEAVYHPACYERVGGQLPSTGGERVFREALCGVDGGEASFAAVEQAARLVGPGGHLTVLVVTSLRTGTGQISGDSATEMVEHANTLADRAGVSCRIEVDPAGPVHEIVSDWASGHDLLAIGAPPKSVLAGMLFSGVTDTAIRSLSTPLLVARPMRAAARFGERMLVASDGLLGSDELVAFASRVAGDGRSALTLIHALGRRSISRRSRIDAQVQSIELQGVDGDPAVIESGSADETIITACARLDASLVVMSSRRRSGLSVLGSVSRRVVHHGGCSVLLVPPDWLQRGAATAEAHA